MEGQSYSTTGASVLLVGFVLYHLGRAIYLLYLDPLSVYPGSPWAAVSEYWEAWHNIGTKPGRRGQTLFLLEKMHRDARYGSAIRLGPNEVHIYDPRYFHELYSLNTRYFKDPSMHKVLGAPSSIIAETDPAKHKARRAPLESLFSRQSILKLEPMLMSKINLCCDRFDEIHKAGRSIEVEWALKSLSIDMVSEFCFGQSVGGLYDDNFKSGPVQVFRAYLQNLHIIKAFPIVRTISQSLPLWLAKMASSTLAGGIELEILVRNRVDTFVAAFESGSKPEFPTLMERMVTAGAKQAPTMQWSREYLRDEALLMISAGTDTTGTSTMVGLFNIIHNKSIQSRLLQELKTILPGPEDTAPFLAIEKLPYLTAVVKESLRYGSPAASRTPRLVPKGGCTLPDGRFLPAGTRVGAAIYHIHYNPDIFPEPHRFLPERWLEADKGGTMGDRLAEMNHFFVPFSKGTRGCLGINLAYMEMYLVLAYLIRRFDFQTTTTEADMQWDDMVIPSFHGEFTFFARRRGS